MLSIKLTIYLTSLLFSLLTMANWFLNQEQQAVYLFEQGRYAEAAEHFPDPFRQGVAWYRAGEYDRAAEAFNQVQNPQLREKARYNLGNTYFQQQQFEKAIDAYQQALQLNPDHQNAQHNLRLAEYYLQKSPQKFAQSNQNGLPSQQEEKQDHSLNSSLSQQLAQPDQNGQQQLQNANSSPQSQSQPSYQISQTPPSEQSEQLFLQEESKPQAGQNVGENGQPNAEDEQLKKQFFVKNSVENNVEKEKEEESSKQPIIITDLPSPWQQENERESMANVLLGKIEGDPAVLLKKQFYLNKERLSRQQNLPKSEQSW